MTVWLITGASRGFGRLLTGAALTGGDKVVAGARDARTVTKAFPEAGNDLLAVDLDVTDAGQVAAAVDAAKDRFGRIDVLVNNAGYGLFGSVEETPDVEVRQLFDTNVFGLLNVTRAVLPVLRRQRSGHVITMSSSAGFASSAGRGMYSASKAAVEAVSEALQEELRPLGIHVTIVEPGSFRTDFLSANSARQVAVGIDDYTDTVGSLLAAIEANDGKQPGDPAAAATAIRRLVAGANPPLRLQLGSDSLRLVEGKLDLVRQESDRWRALALSTDF
ncbi:oxidoreductase [Cryptosporangium arvum]|uniref:Ketoreductase domain-containing protein n=1 Tax=Cryptosporangium arvum DSM 44712 TaxID=927661 RepID=A0A010YQ34_9ACTN|nr:oxidoreductase [Cryptosporangium arvum]EXG82275.1 short-chain dehydrogenase of unknown substrate specificity [Cryptosporangium arvum DSM 44712]